MAGYYYQSIEGESLEVDVKTPIDLNIPEKKVVLVRLGFDFTVHGGCVGVFVSHLRPESYSDRVLSDMKLEGFNENPIFKVYNKGNAITIPKGSKIGQLIILDAAKYEDYMVMCLLQFKF